MTTLKKELSRLKHHFDYIHQKVDEGCNLFNEDQPIEAEIAFSEALQYSEELIDEQPDNLSYQITLAETHHMVSLGFSHIEEYDKAREHLKEAITIYKSIKGIGHDHEAMLNSTAARIEYTAGNEEKAIAILQRNLLDIEELQYEEFDQDSFVYCSNLILLATTYFETDQYEKAVATSQQAIALRNNRAESQLNHQIQDYINLLNTASFQALEQNDMDFHRQVFEELIAFCDQHLDEEPGLLKYKISGQLNYAVFCSKSGNMGTAEEIVHEAISGCMEIDDDGPELTLFMVSALNTLANLQWEQGECRGALRDMSSECKILGDFLEAHPELCSSLLPLLTDLTLNQCRLLYDMGQHEKAEELTTHIKSNVKKQVSDNQATQKAAYLMAIKKIADMHQSVGMEEEAKKEYGEVLFIMKDLRVQLPDLSELFDELEDEVCNILSDNAL